MQNYKDSLRLLEEFHEFPGHYTFKIIGPNSEDWFLAVKNAAQSVLGDIGDCLQSGASSSGQRYQSLNLTVHVESSDKVMQVYAALQKVPEVKMLF